jgi:hypothetical protein
MPNACDAIHVRRGLFLPEPMTSVRVQGACIIGSGCLDLRPDVGACCCDGGSCGIAVAVQPDPGDDDAAGDARNGAEGTAGRGDPGGLNDRIHVG